MKAAIDIGSNSILLTIVDDDGRLILDTVTVIGLGRGLGDRGSFRPDRMDAAEACLARYVGIAVDHGVQPWSVKAVATSAARRAMNAQTFFNKLQRTLGLKTRIISGDEEARLTWMGARRDLELPAGPLMVVDLGGGSTEIIVSNGEEIAARVSLEVGSVRLTEQFLGTDVVRSADLTRARAHIEALLANENLEARPRSVIGVAGTVTTLYAMRQGLHEYDSSKIHGGRLSRADLASLIDQLLPMNPEQRRQAAPIAPDRADYLLAGAMILDRALNDARRPSMIVSDRGLRYGLLDE
ncbi:MAG: exopolyphosphatase/guanosine-5'-triphosphate,3'-diphosphate pyrophosphatase [Kiritimatiellia bacterium]